MFMWTLYLRKTSPAKRHLRPGETRQDTSIGFHLVSRTFHTPLQSPLIDERDTCQHLIDILPTVWLRGEHRLIGRSPAQDDVRQCQIDITLSE
jgi:hypothetical protein